MATHKSAEKRNRQNITRRERNRGARSTVRSAIKDARAAVAAKAPNSKELVQAAERLIAKATNKGLYHKKNGARKISRLTAVLASSAAR